jgi:hypothetical protein
VWNVEEEFGDAEEVPEGTRKPYVITSAVQDLAHQYVLTNVSICKKAINKSNCSCVLVLRITNLGIIDLFFKFAKALSVD